MVFVGRVYVWILLKINVNFLYEIKLRIILNVFLWCKLVIGFYNIEFNKGYVLSIIVYIECVLFIF